MAGPDRLSLLDEVKLQAEVVLSDLYHRVGEAKPGTPRQKWEAVWAEDMQPRIGEPEPGAPYCDFRYRFRQAMRCPLPS